MSSLQQDHREAGAEPTTDFDAVIVGAGFSGLYMLHSLRNELGLSARIYEGGDSVGGTWYWNRYPGARSDSPSHIYSYSFSEELRQEWEWTEIYPDQHEMLSYFDHVVDKFDLNRDIQLGTRVTEATFDEGAKRWTIRTDTGDTVTARFFIAAVGALSSANPTDIPGRDAFAGERYHTGHWPHEGLDFTGKRVGGVGTGSTGIQIIPLIAEEADHLTVFQRTPTSPYPRGIARWTPRTCDGSRRTTMRYGARYANRSRVSNSTRSTTAPWRRRRRSVSARTRPGGIRAASVSGWPTTTTSSLLGKPTTPSPSGCARRSRNGSTTL